jgi:hypothetical protein
MKSILSQCKIYDTVSRHNLYLLPEIKYINMRFTRNIFSYLFLSLAFCSQFSVGQESVYNQIVINEFMASNSNTIADQNGEYDDWVEIYNAGTVTVNLEGFFLTDKRSELNKFQFPSVSLAPDDYLIVWLDNDSLQSGYHANFQLNSDEDKIYLMNADTTVIDHVRFKNAATGQSIGRFPNGVGVKRTMSPSFNGTNVSFGDNYGLVINELMAKNLAGPVDENNEYDDWVELYNNSSASINLNGYFLTNKSSNADKYPITEDVNVGAGEYQIFWLDNQDIQGVTHANFNIEGSGDDLMICDADTTTLDYIRFGFQEENKTFGRYVNGTGGFQVLNATFSAENSNGIGLEEFDKTGLFLLESPVHSSLNLSHDFDTDFSIRIYDATGRFVLEKHCLAADEFIGIDIAYLKPGNYFVKASGGNLIQFSKF